MKTDVELEGSFYTLAASTQRKGTRHILVQVRTQNGGGGWELTLGVYI
jgi:hypothetical protein